MKIPQLLNPLALTPNVEVVIPRLPERFSFGRALFRETICFTICRDRAKVFTITVARYETWTLRFLHAIRIARQCRCQDECCSGVEQCVKDVIYRLHDLRRCSAVGEDPNWQI